MRGDDTGAAGDGCDALLTAADAIESWGRAGLRDLPWRRTRDPWAILVVEVMAQQTGLDRVRRRWSLFMQEFPDPTTMAAAPTGSVVRAWAGLGYNRRALALHAAARRIVAEHAGRVPREHDALVSLPGVGPYTAAAVRAFAFGEPAVVVDTNVGRTLARLTGRRLTPARVRTLAERLAAGRDPWWWNQSLMEFGALVCRSRRPGCANCPVRSHCHWRGEDADPAIGSAAVSTPQSPFAVSDRRGRGRLVDALRHGPVDRHEAGAIMGWPDDPERVERVVAALVDEGLIRRHGDRLVL